MEFSPSSLSTPCHSLEILLCLVQEGCLDGTPKARVFCLALMCFLFHIKYESTDHILLCCHKAWTLC